LLLLISSLLLQLNMVFDGLALTKNFTGYVFFLEEDHYVAPDFIHVARQMIQLKWQQNYQTCDFINLGMYTNIRSFDNHVSLYVQMRRGLCKTGSEAANRGVLVCGCDVLNGVVVLIELPCVGNGDLGF